MGSSLPPIVSNIFIEHLEKLVLDTAQYKPSLWLWYVDDNCIRGLALEPTAVAEFPRPLQKFKAFHPVHCGNMFWSSGKGRH
jgi:hypothetical protein